MTSDVEPNMTEHQEAARRRHPLARGIEVLTTMVDGTQDAYGVRELAAELEVSPSTAHRLVSDLEKLGLVRRTEAGSYCLGLEFLRLAWTTSERFPVQEVSRDILRQLSEASGETAFFSVYGEHKQKMLFALVVESPHPLRYQLPMKQWIPLYMGASGLSILAFLPEEVQRAIVQSPKQGITSRTLVGELEQTDRLRQIREDGFAITHGERIEGAIAIAAPVFGISGQVIGSIGISLPEARFNASQTANLSAMVRSAAEKATRNLNGTRVL